MTKNENNSHSFLRKMVENIKQTKDAQSPDDPKANEKLYIVCDVALFVIANKSTSCHLDSPKDPVLPTKFFTPPDKDFINDKEYLSAEAKTVLTTGKIIMPPKQTVVLATLNKPLVTTVRRMPAKTTPTEMGTIASTNSQPGSPGTDKSRDVNSESSETGARENEENPEKRAVPASDGTENSKSVNPAGSQATPNKPRRGRPPKNATGVAMPDKEAGATTGRGAGRGRKRAAPAQDPASTASTDPISTKTPKQQKEAEPKRATPQRQIDLQR